MGQISEPDDPHAAALSCNNCDTEYWTSRQQSNECPECNRRDFDIHGSSHN